MDYLDLTKQLMQTLHLLKKNKPKHNVSEILQGSAFILKYLYERKEAVFPSEISSEMEISTARIAASLNNLEKKQLINREINKNDRRQILVTLTPKGMELAKRQQQEVESHISGILQSIGEQDAMELIRILNKIINLQGSQE